MEHRAGWDATFSAPKSVSLTALVGGDERVREAHRQSVGYRPGRDGADTFRPGSAGIFRRKPPGIGLRQVRARQRPARGRLCRTPIAHARRRFLILRKQRTEKSRPLQPRELYRRSSMLRLCIAPNWRPAQKDGLRNRARRERPARNQRVQQGVFGGFESPPQTDRGSSDEGKSARRGVRPRSRRIRTREGKLELSHDEMRKRHEDMAAQFGNQPEHVIEAARPRDQRCERTRGNKIAHAGDDRFRRKEILSARPLPRNGPCCVMR